MADYDPIVMSQITDCVNVCLDHDVINKLHDYVTIAATMYPNKNPACRLLCSKSKRFPFMC
jgi:hypothetical protein